MSVTVKCFASISDQTGLDHTQIDYQASMTIADIWCSITDSAMAANTLCALNHQYSDHCAVVCDGDEVAFFPPVTGG